MKRLLVLLVLCAAYAIAETPKATVAEVLKDPDKFHGVTILVDGKVANFRAKVSRAGNKYFTFDLQDGEDHLNVFSQGEMFPQPKEGDPVEVIGKFAKERLTKTAIYKDEIDATPKEKTKNGVKFLKKDTGGG